MPSTVNSVPVLATIETEKLVKVIIGLKFKSSKTFSLDIYNNVKAAVAFFYFN